MHKMTIAPVVARNLSRVRQQRGLTLTGLSEISGIAKSTLSALEAGAGNPTIQTLWALASALDIPFGSLVAVDSGDSPHTTPADTASEGASVRFIERTGSDPEIEAYQMSLEPGCNMESAPHGAGVMETVTAIEGPLLVGDAERPRLLRPGETCRFRADVPHVYRTTDRPPRPMSSSNTRPAPASRPTHCPSCPGPRTRANARVRCHSWDGC